MEQTKVYVLWMKHEYRNQVDRYADGVFTTREKAENRGKNMVKDFPDFYCGFEVETFYLDV